MFVGVFRFLANGTGATQRENTEKIMNYFALNDFYRLNFNRFHCKGVMIKGVVIPTDSSNKE